MKLFIWNNPYSISYGNALLVVVAENVGNARLVAADQMLAKAYSYGLFEQRLPMSAEQVAKLGEPDRVVDIPCAEWHAWKE